MGDPDAVLIVDDTQMIKKGTKSVGVECRQACRFLSSREYWPGAWNGNDIQNLEEVLKHLLLCYNHRIFPRNLRSCEHMDSRA
jgi:hypothetical protein